MQCCDLTCAFETKDVRKSNGADTATFSGVASTSGVDSQNDVIVAGAFEPIALKPSGEPDVLLLRDHDRSQVLGGWKSFLQNGDELMVEGELCLAVEKARETYALMKRGFLSGLSVGFNINDEKGAVQIDERARKRYIRKATLKECSIVAAPANRQARVVNVKDDILAMFKPGGMSREEVELLLNEGVEALIESRKETTPEKPYGDVVYADPGYQEDKKKRYPLDNEQHIRAAWNYIHKPKNRAFYSRDQLDKIEGRIIAAWKRVIDKDGPPAAQEDSEEPPAEKKGTLITGIDGFSEIDAKMVQEAMNKLHSQLKARYHV